MTKKNLIQTTILVIILVIITGIGLNLKIKTLRASQVEPATMTATLSRGSGQLEKLEPLLLVQEQRREQLVLNRLALQVETRELVSVSGNLQEL